MTPNTEPQQNNAMVVTTPCALYIDRPVLFGNRGTISSEELDRPLPTPALGPMSIGCCWNWNHPGTHRGTTLFLDYYFRLYVAAIIPTSRWLDSMCGATDAVQETFFNGPRILGPLSTRGDRTRDRRHHTIHPEMDVSCEWRIFHTLLLVDDSTERNQSSSKVIATSFTAPNQSSWIVLAIDKEWFSSSPSL
jgi:hypothetical protein